MKPILYIVIPCYNEQEVLPVTAPEFLKKIKDLTVQGKISDESRILFVNDGSKDTTWEIIKKLASEDIHYTGISQSRNRGHQNAVLAGLMEAKDKCDITISIDCDGITSLSVKPMHLIIGTGCVVGLGSLLTILGGALTGMTNLLLTGIICLVLELNLLGLGIVGEYTGKIYMETKRRPRYIISERT